MNKREYKRIVKGQPTLRDQVYAALATQDQTCYDLEAGLNRAHQSVSATIRRLVLAGEVADTGKTKKNQFGNEVRVYTVV